MADRPYRRKEKVTTKKPCLSDRAIYLIADHLSLTGTVLAGEDRLLELRPDLVEQPRRRREDDRELTSRFHAQCRDIHEHQEDVQVPAVSTGSILGQINGRVSQVPDTVAVSLPAKVGVLGVETGTGNTGSHMRDTMLLELATNDAIAGRPAISGIG